MKILIASDHAGFELKEYLKQSFPQLEWIDEGPSSVNKVDYPDYAQIVAKKVSKNTVERGVLVCGSGVGMAIVANKFPQVRAVAAESEFSAKLSRSHNDTNILCLGARLLSPEYAKDIFKIWLETSFERGRHEKRIQKILEIEKNLTGV